MVLSELISQSVNKAPAVELVLDSVVMASDAHGYRDLCGFTGTGVTGAGVGHQISIRDIPVPVWAGDRSVTRSHQSDMSVFSTHHEHNGRL